MALPAIEEQVIDLRETLNEFIRKTEIGHLKLQEAQLETKRELKQLSFEMRLFKDEMRLFKDEMNDFKDEMTDFKNEMRIFKDEMTDFKNEMRIFKDEMTDFKDEMRVFKDEMIDFKDETVEDRKRMNKQWGELANRLGTVVEDIVAPNIEGIAQRYFGCTELDSLMVRYRKRNPKNKSQRREFDVIALWDNTVLLNETKATARMEYIAEFAAFLGSGVFFEYFPEYRDKTFIPVFSSLYLSDEMVRALSNAGIYAMAMSDDSMDLLNFDRVKRV
jgi:chromosome segregation ATPase